MVMKSRCHTSVRVVSRFVAKVKVKGETHITAPVSVIVKSTEHPKIGTTIPVTPSPSCVYVQTV